MNLKLVREQMGKSIPPAVSQEMLRVYEEQDHSLEAALAKLDFADYQMKDLNQRLKQLEAQY